MTISSTTRQAGPFTGNDVTVTFAFTFKVFSASDLQLVRTLTSTGVSTTLTITTDYTVTLNADQNSAPGGSVTLTSALATGYTLIITSDIAALQSTDLTNQGGFYPQVITNALDKLTILVQQILSKIGRSITYPLTDPTSLNNQLPGATFRANKALVFNTDGSVGVSVDNYVDQAANAAASAAASASSATASSGSASAAAGSASSASSSATNSATSAANAANSAAAAAAAVGTVKNTTSDTTSGVLNTKLVVDSTLVKTTLNPGGNENLQVALNLANVNSWTKAQRGSVSALTYGATITPDFSLANNYSVTLTGNATLANPTNLVAGQSGIITVAQDATGSRTMAFGTYWKFTGGTAPTLTTAASSVDDIAYYVESTTRIVAKVVGDVR